MRAALAQWDEIVPVFLHMLDAWIDGTDRSERAGNVLFIALHLMAEVRETRAFAPLCALAQDDEALEEALGDATTVTLPGILIRTYDGSLSRLQTVIEDTGVDDFARSGALNALAWLTAAGQIPQETTAKYLRDLFTTLKSDGEGWVWVGWQDAISCLGFADMAGMVQKVFSRGWIHRSIMSFKHFEEDLRQRQRDTDPMAAFARQRVRPVEDSVAELSGWACFNEAPPRPTLDAPGPASAITELADDPAWYVPSTPVINPYRNVGRNDLCPCGSGQKFKKCCLEKLGQNG
jgi:hypothetical protein